MHRFLEEEEPPPEKWEKAYAVIVIFFMFVVLITDRVGAAAVMVTVLTAFMVPEIISVKEALAGFSSQGVLTVLTLFVVAEGITKTGALGWYVSRLLGSPSNVGIAQARIMIPCCIVSAFLNNTPIVVVMLPIVQYWARNAGVNQKKLLIPLSFAVIFGGTCSLIGTSTNLVVEALFAKRYPDLPSITMFGITKYGVPVALTGMSYILLATPYLLARKTPGVELSHGKDILLRARLTQWSPAAGRTVQRSGLRDTGGIYLVSVLRVTTGNLHRAVSRDFVLNVGDILYFTGLVEGFGQFCEEHGLELITNEVEEKGLEVEPKKVDVPKAKFVPREISTDDFDEVLEYDDSPEINIELGVTKESLLESSADSRLRAINKLTDLIHGMKGDRNTSSVDALRVADPPQVIVAVENDLVVVGINARDRPGLLLDISKSLFRLNLQLHHTEAGVVVGRSISIWRCETIGNALPDVQEIWTVVSSLLADESGVEAVKQRGVQVIRAEVLKDSRLIGKTAAKADFRRMYKAAIVAVGRGGEYITSSLSKVVFVEGDTIVVQANADSSLLQIPPAGFYENLHQSKSRKSILSLGNDSGESGDLPVQTAMEVWKDLKVLSDTSADGLGGTKEFLTAVAVVPNSGLVGKSAVDAGLTRLPDLYLVSIERIVARNEREVQTGKLTIASGGADGSIAELSESGDSTAPTDKQVFASITKDDPLDGGDILWFSGSAKAIGDLRKVPGLVQHENEEVEKMNVHVHNRRLVQAVVARNGPLIGKTVKQTQFRTVFGAAVIAVHRQGKRVHEYPGNVKLQAGDVLLLEAGPTFIARSSESDQTFALVSEVSNSAPPRLRMLIPALVITIGMILSFTTEITELITAALVAGILFVLLGILSEKEAFAAIAWDVYVTIGCAFGVGTALVNSGVAEAVANFLVDVGDAIGIGDTGLYGAVYLTTILVCTVLTNNAAAALVFPIGLEAADKAGVNPLLMSYIVMFSASASFTNPVAYTTNLLVYGAGGYKFREFFYFGAPMQILLFILTTCYVSVIEPWYVSWIATLAVFIAILLWRIESWNFFLRVFGGKD